MSLVELSTHNELVVLRLNDGVTNPISFGMLDDLGACIAEVRKAYRGLVLAGGPKFFSIGLDLPNLLELDREGFSRFVEQFQKVLWDLFSLPLPTASAIEGHAVAGGTILALMTDYRYLARGKSVMGLNEVKLGLSVPYLAELMLRRLLPDNLAKEMLYTGEFVRPEQAAQIGLVDELCGQMTCEQIALAKLEALVQLPAAALAALKHNRLESISIQYQANQARETKRFIDLWFTPQAQGLLKEATKTF